MPLKISNVFQVVTIDKDVALNSFNTTLRADSLMYGQKITTSLLDFFMKSQNN